MDFLKKHYEKLILGLVLVGLAVAVGFLPFYIAGNKAALEEQRQRLIHPKVKPLTNLDLTMPTATLQRVSSATPVDFSPPNKVFNPMPWQKAADGNLIPATKVGPMAATVTNINPLYTRITLDQIVTTDSGPKYLIGVQREAEMVPSKRTKKQTLCTATTKNEFFAVLEVKGKPEEPSQIVLELNDTGERVSISKAKPFLRVDGYTADVRYDPERQSWPNRRVGSLLRFNGEDYNIVAINRSEVVLSARSNQKKWTIKLNPNDAS